MLSIANLNGVPVGHGHPVRIMGIINVSPESFYKGSIPSKGLSLKEMAHQMEEEGADFLDVGAMSTAPYLKTQISEQEEAKRLEKALRVIKKATKIPISVDTSRAWPARVALQLGATILNDVHGLKKDPDLAHLAKRFQGVILMAHPEGHNENMFSDPLKTISVLWKESLRIAKKHDVPFSKIVLDPGIGFFRNAQLPWWKWDMSVIQALSKFNPFGRPLLVGISRKSFLKRFLNGAPPEERLPASLVATLIAVQNGATLIRTHDVKDTRTMLNVAMSLLK